MSSPDECWKNEETGTCKICGPNQKRMHTWTAADYENPLRTFLEWLINGLPGGKNRRTRTIAMAHFGG